MNSEEQHECQHVDGETSEGPALGTGVQAGVVEQGGQGRYEEGDQRHRDLQHREH